MLTLPCGICGGQVRYDTTVPSVVWNEAIRAAGLPEYLCAACILEQFALRDESFTCDLWGDAFHGVPVVVQFHSRRARSAQRVMAENTRLRYRLAEAERACEGFRTRLEGAEGRPSREAARVVIESPLRAPTREGIERHRAYAMRAVRDALARGEAPYASHLFFDRPGLLDDRDEAQRERGMWAGFAWGAAATRVAVYTDLGISAGMRLGIALAEERGQLIEYRQIGADTEEPA